MRALRSIAIFLFAFCALDIAYGQTQEGRILGTVTDQSGGLVKGARVTSPTWTPESRERSRPTKRAITSHPACHQARTNSWLRRQGSRRSSAAESGSKWRRTFVWI